MTATVSESDRLGLVMALARDKGRRPSSNEVRSTLSCGRAVANQVLAELDRLDRPPAQGGPTLLPRPAEPATPQVADLQWATGPEVAQRGPTQVVGNQPPGWIAAVQDRVARTARATTGHRTAPAGSPPPVHRGWLVLLALPAFVAVWGGWTGLGGLAGFGPVEMLPGIWPALKVNLAVTLPAGMEVYSVIGLRVWLSSRTRTQRTRRFAMLSTCAALMIGCTGQIAFHVLARTVASTPMFITVGVACLPVAVLGMGAALFHLVSDDQRENGDDL